MSVKFLPHVSCDTCKGDAETIVVEGQAQNTARSNARDLGWQTRLVGSSMNPDTIDVCPGCVESGK